MNVLNTFRNNTKGPKQSPALSPYEEGDSWKGQTKDKPLGPIPSSCTNLDQALFCFSKMGTIPESPSTEMNQD